MTDAEDPKPKEDNESKKADEKKSNDNKDSSSFDPAAEVMSGDNVPYVGTFVSAIVLLTALLAKDRYKNSKNFAYGISVACIAMFFALTGFAISKLKKLDGNILLGNNLVLFLWSFIGACILTFDSPFKVSGNGYFASWGIAVFSVMGLGVTREHMVGIGPLMGLFAASVIVIIAAGVDWSDSYTGELIYGIIVAALSVVACGFLAAVKDGTDKMVNFFILAFLAINWIVSACVLTFRGPFLVTGNGYFGSWAGVVTSIFATKAVAVVSFGKSDGGGGES